MVIKNLASMDRHLDRLVDAAMYLYHDDSFSSSQRHRFYQTSVALSFVHAVKEIKFQYNNDFGYCGTVDSFILDLEKMQSIAALYMIRYSYIWSIIEGLVGKGEKMKFISNVVNRYPISCPNVVKCCDCLRLFFTQFHEELGIKTPKLYAEDNILMYSIRMVYEIRHVLSHSPQMIPSDFYVDVHVEDPINSTPHYQLLKHATRVSLFCLQCLFWHKISDRAIEDTRRVYCNGNFVDAKRFFRLLHLNYDFNRDD